MPGNREFHPKTVERFEPRRPGRRATLGDERSGSVYVYSDPRVVLAVNVALVTGRPLLVRGPSGSGKSSLAHNVANVLGWRYYEQVVSSRTQARDLLWEVDLLRRLQDAQVQGALKDDIRYYIAPGVIWWAFDRESALRRSLPEDADVVIPSPPEPGEGPPTARAVVLLDEIDKADPDVPNNLLVPLGSLEFQIPETGTVVSVEADHAPLIFLTTNEERDLPAAFLRRCVQVQLTQPTREMLIQVGGAHFPDASLELLEGVADLLAAMPTDRPAGAADGSGVSTAEYLDAVRACLQLGLSPGSGEWEDIAAIILDDSSRPGPAVPR